MAAIGVSLRKALFSELLDDSPDGSLSEVGLLGEGLPAYRARFADGEESEEQMGPVEGR